MSTNKLVNNSNNLRSKPLFCHVTDLSDLGLNIMRKNLDSFKQKLNNKQKTHIIRNFTDIL